MSISSFDELHSTLQPLLQRQNTHLRNCISPKEMIAVTIRYLVTGCTFTELHYSYRMGISTISCAVRSVCRAIITVLREECIPVPPKAIMETIADGFEKRANFPHCIGLQRLGNKMVEGTKRKDANTTLNGAGPQNSSKSKNSSERQRKEIEKIERQSLVLWKRPLTTVEYFCREVIVLLRTYGRKILANKKLVTVVLISVLSIYILVNSKGPHQNLVQGVYKKLLWCLYWMGLGILSSVGLGTGLHTFLLYLGPHIAQVTLAAYECESLNFPEPPYPDDIICPNNRDTLSVTIFSIMAKVRLEAMCWGAGTALGELPPYFMARAARLSGIDPDDEDDELKELEELERKKQNRDKLTLIERGKLFVEEIVEKVGFLGILACASIPNPLFDLAGITCGHFLVPFWTFFGATLIGKAIIKMHIQKLFVIIAFNETLIESAIEWLKIVPLIGEKLQVPFKAFLNGQKLKLHKKSAGSVPNTAGGNILGSIFEKFVIAMVLYFIISIVNSFAQSYHKRINKKKNAKANKD